MKAINKKAAMEMSVGTMVTIVLLMIVLVLGVVLIRSIFSGSQDAVEAINSQVIDEINRAFSDDTAKISVAPSDRAISLERNKDPAGFAFSVRNKDDGGIFSYIIGTDVNGIASCKSSFSTFSVTEAENYLLEKTGSFNLGRGAKLDLPILVKFQISENAPPCTITYRVNICKAETCSLTTPNPYTSVPQVTVTIK
ncbi:MAG: hypothetical protein AABW50_03250 [Nanoarchaeota archaeon]